MPARALQRAATAGSRCPARLVGAIDRFERQSILEMDLLFVVLCSPRNDEASAQDPESLLAGHVSGSRSHALSHASSPTISAIVWKMSPLACFRHHLDMQVCLMHPFRFFVAIQDLHKHIPTPIGGGGGDSRNSHSWCQFPFHGAQSR